jgi:hypothetical protein
MRVLLVMLAACAPDDKAPSSFLEDPDVDGLVLGPVQPCSAPQESPSWTEAPASWTPPEPLDPDEAAGSATSVAVLDLDDNGWQDMVVAYGDDELGALVGLQDDTGWDWRPLEGLGGEPVEGVGLGLGDLDGDGWIDLTLAGEDPVLLRNTGGVLEAHAVPEPILGLARELLPVDLDGDGSLELVVGMSDPDPDRSVDRILWAEGDPFAGDGYETTLLRGPGAGGENWDTIAYDADNDGTLDLYTTNDKGSSRGPNGLYLAPDYDDAASALGADLRLDGMGSSLGDIDGDGRADLYVAAVGRDAVLLGQPDGSFAEGGAALGATPDPRTDDEARVGMPWGTALWDADNDGWTDILVAEGDFGTDDLERLDRPALAQDLRLLHQSEPGDFEDRTGQWLATGPGHWRAVVAAELNGDGVQDVVATRQGRAPTVFLSAGCTEAGWLGVNAPVGAVVTVEVGGRLLRSWVVADTGFGAARSPQAWIGLGRQDTVDDVTIELPGGERITTGPLRARRWLTVER